MNRTNRPMLLGALLLVLGLAITVLYRSRPLGAEPAAPWSAPLVDRDLDRIGKDTLRVLVVVHPLTYEEFPGGTRGAEFELLERFAKHMGLPLRAVPVVEDSLLPLLQRGSGDLIAAQVHESRFGTAVAISAPYWHASPVLVRLREDQLLDLTPSAQDTVWMPRTSPWMTDTALHLHGPRGFAGDIATGSELIERVALGAIRAALVTDGEARYHLTHLPQLVAEEAGGERIGLRFALRRNATRLREALDRWLAEEKETEARAPIMGSYGERLPKRKALGRARKTLVSGDPISPFDSLFQEKAELMHWEWELLAAIAFKESRFDTSAQSGMGAQGMMQMMPNTAERLGVDSVHLVEGQVHAAAIYLAMLDSIWRRTIPDADERLHFVLAAYNAGPGHVQDAQRLAERMGLDRRIWMGHVERAITLLAFPVYYTGPGMSSGRCKGDQTFLYVREVLGLYAQFQRGR
ncbi:MAG: transglycosylase SLT domain-containing protein [Flavobacteriales bacterium]|nr:transglycosylase SLT domain-containing protein [Flavobacteriales bacterium]